MARPTIADSPEFVMGPGWDDAHLCFHEGSRGGGSKEVMRQADAAIG